MLTDPPRPWEPGSFRNLQRFHAFMHARDLPPSERSIRAAYNQHRVQCLKKSGERAASGRWELWSREDDWLGRLGAYDGEIDRQRRARFLKAQLDASERHGRQLQAAIMAIVAPIRIAIDAMTPESMQRLRTQAQADAHGARAALIEARLAAVSLPALIAAERLTLGMPDGYSVIEDRRQDFERDWVDRQLANPKAVDLLIALQNEMCSTPPPDFPAGTPQVTPEPMSQVAAVTAGENQPESSTAPAPIPAAFDDGDD